MFQNQGIQHVFAMDNLDWKRKTLEGGNINATIVENIGKVTSDEDARRFKDVNMPIATSGSRKTLTCMSNTTIPLCYISAKHPKISPPSRWLGR